MEELETLESTECPECPGPPPEFRLPPPPRPPFLTEGTFCSEAPLVELEDCVAAPMIDASYHTNPSLQSTALIITCAVVLLLMAAIVSVVFWKHKRKVQNLLPCKSASGSAASAAASTAAAGRGRVLSEGQSHSGSGGAGGAILYEDLPEAVPHSQLHNHLPSHHSGQAPTIEVRATNPDRHRARLRERQPQPQQQPQSQTHPATQRAARTPGPHHLDYLDYRDPRAILRVTDKPSRAVLGGYRTPRALLAKSQGVPMSIATHAPRGPTAVTSPLLQNSNHALRDSHLLLATQNALITSHHRPLSPAPTSPSPTTTLVSSTSPNPLILSPQEQPETSCLHPEIYSPTNDCHESSCSFGSRISAIPKISGIPITPTHRPRIQPPIDAPYLNSKSHAENVLVRRIPTDEGSAQNDRRPSVDSEGYSYIDFKDAGVESSRDRSETSVVTAASQRLLRFPFTRSNSIDSDGYSYIVDPGLYRRLPGTARRIVADGTEEEVCPLCTMQQIHNLLSKPEEVYLNVQDT